MDIDAATGRPVLRTGNELGWSHTGVEMSATVPAMAIKRGLMNGRCRPSLR
jgi:hypothetical protein